MLFNSLTFIAFLAIVLPLYYRLDHRRQNILLTIASYVFYGWWDYRFLILLWISTGLDFLCARAIGNSSSERHRKILITISVVGNLTLLGIFKYLNFFADSFVKALNAFGLQADPVTLNIVLPVGISFYTFQTLSYTIDVYRRDLPAAQKLSDFALYISFFPQLVAGPIERATTLMPQVQQPRRPHATQIMDGIWLALLGYIKKLVIADRAVEIVRLGFGGTALPDGTWSWIYLYAFAFQIYGDFSGYSDIARGLAKIMGFELMTNFQAPYLVTNPSAFWRNWHISLSTWLRDYVYIPLGGNRKGERARYRNLLLTMILGGLWHGAGWAYLIWGVFHGTILVIHRMMQPAVDRVERVFGRLGRATFNTIAVVVFFHITCIGWLLFRAGALPKRVDQLSFISHSLASMFSMPVSPLHSVAVMHALRVVAVLAVLVVAFQASSERMDRFHAWTWPSQVAAVTGALAVIAAIGVFTGAEFIYFQF